MTTEPTIAELQKIMLLAREWGSKVSQDLGAEFDQFPIAAVIDKADAWLKDLQQAPSSRQVEMAFETLAANGVIMDWWPGTEKVLEISTGHVTEETGKLLDIEAVSTAATALELIVYAKGEYGWFIFVPDEDMMSETVPEELAGCFVHARKAGCKWLCLDCDADLIDELPQFPW